MQQGKQYSFWHKLPKSKDKLITIIPRTFLKDKYFLTEFSPKIGLPLILFISHFLLNNKTSVNESPVVEIKRSSLRNFIGKKIHSKKASELDEQLNNFFYSLSQTLNKTIYFELKGNKILFSFYDKYYKKLAKGDTVSINLFDFTSIRGEKAKMVFLNILSFDLRKKEKFSKLSNLVNLLSLDFSKRKENIQKIKRTFLSISKKGFINFKEYVGISNTNAENYRFNYDLASLLQK